MSRTEHSKRGPRLRSHRRVHNTATPSQPPLAAQVLEPRLYFSVSASLMLDANSSAAGSYPDQFVSLDGAMVFTASDEHGKELWRTDGTPAGTMLVKDIAAGWSSSSPSELTRVGSQVFFTAQDGSGRELWRTDGTASGTVRVKDIVPGALGSNPRWLTEYQGVLYFSPDGAGLWRSDGTDTGTYKLSDTTVFGALVGFEGHIVFSGWGSDTPAQENGGQELYYVNPAGGGGWFDINTFVDSYMGSPGSSSPDKLAVVGTSLYFAADVQQNSFDLQRRAYRLTKSTSGGLALSQVTTTSYQALFTSWSSAKVGAIAGAALFTDGSYDPATGNYTTSLFKVTESGVTRITGGYSGVTKVVSDGTVAYCADPPDAPGDRARIWRVDASSNSTTLMATGPQTGNGDGTEQLDDPFEQDQMGSGSYSAFASVGVMIGGSSGPRYFFGVDDGTSGYELWKSDGTTEGTSLVSDINSRTQSSVPQGRTTNQDTGMPVAPAAAMQLNSTTPAPAWTAAPMTAAAGSALFHPGVDFAIPASPTSMAIADFNGDGLLDVATSDTEQVSVLLNTTSNGSETPAFAPRVLISAGVIDDMAAGDFNQDGRPDLAFIERWSQRLAVMFNTTPQGATTPSFGSITRFSATTNGNVQRATIADFNGDGKPDVAATSFDYYGKYYGDTGYAHVLLNTTSAGATTPAFSSPALIAETRTIRGVATGDFDADGRPDLAWSSADSVCVARNVTANAAGSALFAPAITASFAKAATLAVADFNGDGKPDLAAGTLDGRVGVLLSDTVGSTIAFRPQALFSTGLTVTPPLAADDFSGDGLIDIAFASTSGAKAGGVLVNGTAVAATTLSFVSTAVTGLDANQPCLATADFNSDGLPDIAAGRRLTVYPATGAVRVLLAKQPTPPASLPGTPTSVTGTVGDGHVILRWNAPTESAGITDYLVQCSSDGSSWQTVDDGVSSTTTAAVTGLRNGSAYSFRVAARNAGGDGAYSAASASLTPSAVPIAAPRSLFYAATDGTSGLEPWVTDGTAGGTRRVADIASGVASSFPSDFTRVGDKVYFLANGVNGPDLWKSDGTAAGTSKIPLTVGTETLSSATDLTAAGQSLFFAAFSNTYGTELFRHDLATGITSLVADIAPRSSWGFAEGSYPSNLCSVGVVLYFTADDADNPGARRVWRTDGLTGTAAPVSAPQFGWPRELTAMGGSLYYVDDTTSPALWRVDGPQFEAVKVAQFNGMTGYENLGLRAAADRLYFVASDGTAGRELWVSDGTTAGTRRVRDLVPGMGAAFPSSYDMTLVTAGSLAYFLAGPQGGTKRLWRSDGTESGTFLLDGPSSSPTFTGVSRLDAVGERAYFAASDAAAGEEFWSTDGSVVGTARIADVWAGSTGSRPSLLGLVGSTLLFMADDGIHGREPWSYNLTPATDSPVIVPTGQTSTDPTTRTGAFQLVKQGGGTLILDKANSHAGGTVVESGRIVVKNASALGTGTVRVKAGATLVLDPAAGEVLAQSLVIEDGGFVDLGTGRIRIATGMTASSLMTALLAAKGDGTWNGFSGVGSTAVTSAIASITPRTLGWLDNGDGSLTVSFAAPGDTGLDGVVDITDVANFLASAKMDTGNSATWDAGDFNLDGVVDQLDLADFLGAALFDIGPYVSNAAGVFIAQVDEMSASPTSAMTASADLQAISMMQAFASLASDTPSGTKAKKAAFASLR